MMTTASNTQKSEIAISLRTDETYVILTLDNSRLDRKRISWRYNGVPQCCAFAMVTNVNVEGYNGDSWSDMGKSWLRVKQLFKEDKTLYRRLVALLNAEHDPRRFIAGYYGLGSLVFMNMNRPSKELKSFNEWFVKLWKDAWGVEWGVMATGVSRYKSGANRNREYGIDAFLWENIPFPRAKEEKEKIDVADYEEDGLEHINDDNDDWDGDDEDGDYEEAA
jgi:hypothetical protein